MGVGADHGLAGGGQALLGQEGVLYPHAAHIVEMGDVKALGELPHLGAELGGLDVLAGGVVIQNQDLLGHGHSHGWVPPFYFSGTRIAWPLAKRM